ncbi:MAG: arginine deiminase-related protein [Marinobacterium sp.]|nr:arginine deiminase-related protein [Marinobacterium sp.]
MSPATQPQRQSTTQLANTVLMVRPEGFEFNAQTGTDNEFQHRLATSKSAIRQQAMNEFSRMAERLQAEGVNVLILEKDPRGITPPDAVFPNNWFTTTHAGEIHIFPMLTPNRREERRVSASCY